MKKKSLLTALALSLFSAGALSTIKTKATEATVDYAYSDFIITAGATWKKDGSGDLKDDDMLQFHVKWTYSSESSHKEWFRMTDKNGNVSSVDGLLEYLSSSPYIRELDGTKVGNTYYLWAKREHIINPTTTVKGTWDS